MLTRLRNRQGLGPADRVVIVGAGPAGITAAESLRRLGFLGQVMVISDEGTPYDRPACSKGLLTGDKRPQDARIHMQDVPGVDWRLHRRIVTCDLADRTLWAHTGEGFRFDGLVIAAGSRPQLPADWPEGPGLYPLHSLDDAIAVRRRLRTARTVAVIGGGLTGCEVAAAAVSLGRRVTLVHSRQTLMTGALDAETGRMVTDEHAAAGVDLRLGRRVQSVARYGTRWWLTLDDGAAIEADLVVATLGERPDIDWLDETGLAGKDGVDCDESLRVIGTEGIVAAGSLARWPNLRLSTEPARCGQWIAAVEQGVAAARTLLAGPGQLEPVTLLPRYWTHQYDLRISVCGDVSPDTETVVVPERPGRRRPARSGVCTFHYRGADLVGVVAVNAPRPFTATARGLLTATGPAAVTTTAELSVPLFSGRRRQLAS
jgi:NADPH-dependent 2,4-dienoyl-CoA reductase/sulfur reductase-like enzyme